MNESRTPHSGLDDGTAGHAFALVDGCAVLVRLAGGLADGGRPVDLTGLDQEVGRACAALLDLPAEHAASARKRLDGLLRAIDAVIKGLAARQCPHEPAPDAG